MLGIEMGVLSISPYPYRASTTYLRIYSGLERDPSPDCVDATTNAKICARLIADGRPART